MTPSPARPSAADTIQLGCFDANVSDSTCQAFVKEVETTTRAPLAAINAGLDKLTLHKYQPVGQMSVADVQTGLKAIGFFPAGDIDGICGYRTQSAVRLFQEYVRSVEKAADFLPDGRFGPQTQAHLKRWMDGGLKSQWMETMAGQQAGTLGQTEFADWLALLEKVKQQYLTSPNRMIQKVNAHQGDSCTRKVAQWDFSPQNAHLIGIRRGDFSGKFEDIFVLLLKGLVFKFQGSTDPGFTEDPRGFPFLVQGQHDYHFGWHKRTYLAMKPQTGVLVVRSKDKQLTDADLNKELEANSSINVHWGGPGMAKDVNNWSEGCQVINGTIYAGAAGEFVDCSKFAAVSSAQPLNDPTKTRGAYNVLLDLVTTFASDKNAGMRYTMLVEQDLDLNQTLKQKLADARSKAVAAFQSKV